ncbi:MAG: riboflavin kinase [Patescibacteria group bacterium]
MKTIRGTVIHGDKLGRKLGFRTANFSRRALSGKGISNGVYAARVIVREGCYRTLVIIGVAPLRGKGIGKVEAHLLGFTGNLYGRKLEVTVVKKIRNLVAFESTKIMRKQVQRDIVAVKKIIR